jgi:hypothetical protein
MATNDSFCDIVDFVEDHGGSLSGERRVELEKLVQSYASDWMLALLLKVSASNG